MLSNERKVPSPNRLVHEPARLAILVVLSTCASADFVFLQNTTGLSKGNLSVQLSNLEKAGLIQISKRVLDGRLRTLASIAQQGRSEVESYWRTMDEIRARMKKLKALGPPTIATAQS